MTNIEDSQSNGLTFLIACISCTMNPDSYLIVRSRTIDLSLRGDGTLVEKRLIRTNATLVKSYVHSHLILESRQSSSLQCGTFFGGQRQTE